MKGNYRMLALKLGRRNRVLLRLLYARGVRVGALCALRWTDVQDRKEGTGQISVFGKGETERQILLPASVYRELLTLRAGAPADALVRQWRKGGHALDTSQVLRIVRGGQARLEVEGKKVTPHWLRHCHATHELERGEPIHLVAATFGHASVATT